MDIEAIRQGLMLIEHLSTALQDAMLGLCACRSIKQLHTSNVSTISFLVYHICKFSIGVKEHTSLNSADKLQSQAENGRQIRQSIKVSYVEYKYFFYTTVKTQQFSSIYGNCQPDSFALKRILGHVFGRPTKKVCVHLSNEKNINSRMAIYAGQFLKQLRLVEGFG